MQSIIPAQAIRRFLTFAVIASMCAGILLGKGFGCLTAVIDLLDLPVIMRQVRCL